MAQIEGPARELLDSKNHAVVSTLNENGSIHSTVVWANVEDGVVAVNSAVGRKWPSNLERDPRITVTVYDESNPYEYVEIRGTAWTPTRTRSASRESSASSSWWRPTASATRSRAETSRGARVGDGVWPDLRGSRPDAM